MTAINIQPVAEICSASHDDAQFGERDIKLLRDISGFEYGTPLYAGAAPAAVAPRARDLLGIVRTAQSEARRLINGEDSGSDLAQTKLDLPETLRVLEHALSQPAAVAGPVWGEQQVHALAIHMAASAPPSHKPRDYDADMAWARSALGFIAGHAPAAPALEAPAAPVPAMPATDARQLYDNDQPDGYMESDMDWLRRNEEALSWLIDNQDEIRTALAAAPQAPAAPAEGLAADVEAVLTLLEEHEWAEHCTKTPLGQRLEAAITELHNEIHAAEDAPYAAAPAVTIDPASFEGLIAAVRSLPTTRATEFDGEESDGTPQRWRNRPFVSRTQLERLLRERVAAPAAPAVDAPVKILSQAARDVLAERRRQVEAEGYEPEADEMYQSGELARAAATYALLATGDEGWRVEDNWPRGMSTLKRAEPRRMLEKAGALILADMERLDRAAAQAAAKGEQR